MGKVESIDALGEIIAKILDTDRWVFVGCDGEMGEGKSCITSQLAKSISKHTKVKFSYDNNMTYLRKELKTWVDGDKDGKGQLPEKSAVLADELISMFFKRNWFDSEQIDGIELLNKCRDRHLAIMGNIPCFWDLDSAIYPIMTFWIHVHERGRAWVFQKDRNPFAADKWHKRENEKVFRKHKNPYRCHGYLCEIHFDDWTPRDKARYYKIRNIKRVKTEGQRRKQERYRHIKQQRDDLIKLAFTQNEDLTCKDLHGVIPSLTTEAIRLIKIGAR